ncbi:MAG TPA: divalent cation transporter [Thermoplasmata archaeon]|nr:divalent cation transporter [Thermoplasmata archaeon]
MPQNETANQFLKESIPVLFLCGLGLMAAGSLFGSMVDTLEERPGLLVLIPAIIGMRGNISTALGSRLSSASHLGLIRMENILDKESQINMKASLLLSMLMGILAGLVGHFLLTGLGKESSGILPLVTISLLAGLISGVILSLITLGIMVLSFKKGYDPDNITGPLLSTVGDVITLLVIFGTSHLVFSVL